MNAHNDNTAPGSTTTWWRWGTPPRSGMQRLIAPWEYRHLRAWAGARIATGIVLAGLGAVTPHRGFLFTEGCRVRGAVPGGGGGATLVRRLGAGYRSFRICPNLSLRCSHWPGGC